MTKISSPRRPRARGSVQNQITIFDFISRAASASQPSEPPPDPHVQLQQHQGQVEPLVQQIRDVQIGERPEEMDIQASDSYAEEHQQAANHQAEREHAGEHENQLAPEHAGQQAGDQTGHVQNNPQGLPVVGRGVGEDFISLQERVDPEIPGPLPTILEDGFGWGEIDKLGVWDCILSPFSAIEEVPAQHREAWAMAMDQGP